MRWATLHVQMGRLNLGETGKFKMKIFVDGRKNDARTKKLRHYGIAGKFNKKWVDFFLASAVYNRLSISLKLKSESGDKDFSSLPTKNFFSTKNTWFPTKTLLTSDEKKRSSNEEHLVLTKNLAWKSSNEIHCTLFGNK